MKTLTYLLTGLFLITPLGYCGGDSVESPPKNDWNFNGLTSTFDRATLQRGLVVYKQVCAACHSLKYVYYRDLKHLGYSNEQIKSFAAQDKVPDTDEDGAPTMRRAKPTDKILPPYPNAKAAMAANNGKEPPDLTTMIKARKNGADYMYGLITSGYVDAPKGFPVGDGLYYNKFFPGNLLGMTPPLMDGMVTYDDGTKATVKQMAHDVVTFLTWTSDPSLEWRKRMGIKFMIFMLILTILMYLSKRKIWSDVN